VAGTPDRKFFYQREVILPKRYLSESGISALPATLDDYLAKVVAPTLERQKKAGAVPVKFEAVYLRSLNFAEPQEDEARQIFCAICPRGYSEQDR
jgi:hypothetical protein